MKIGQMTEEQAEALCCFLIKKYPRRTDKQGRVYSYDSCKRCPFGIPASEIGDYKCCQYVTWIDFDDDHFLRDELGDEYDRIFGPSKEETE